MPDFSTLSRLQKSITVQTSGRRVAGALNLLVDITGIKFLDDLGKVAISEIEKSFLLDIIEDRSGALSAIIVGQRPYNDWHGFIDNPVIADAILDRLSRYHHIKLC